MSLVVPDPAAFDLAAVDHQLQSVALLAGAHPRVADGGIPLTSAGYLRPDDVLGASAVVPGAAGWIGARNREIQTFPVLAFRESLQHLGLLRKHKGTLRLTRKGTTAQRGPTQLWATLASSLVPAKAGFAQDATLLLLARAAHPDPARIMPDDLVTGLDDLGYRHPEGTPVELRDLLDLEAVTALANVDEHIRRPNWTTHPLASALARAALQR